MTSISILQLFNYDFARMALIATLFISLTCGFLSPVVVLKQRSYLGDTLSHLVFPGVVFGIILSEYTQLPQWGCVILGATFTAFIGTFLSEWILKILDTPPDSAAVVCLSSFFALGVLIISSQKGLRISPDSLFFGDVLTLNKIDVSIIFISFLLVTFSILSLKKHWDAWLVDTEFAEIAGFKVNLLNKLFPFLLTVSVLSGLFAVGGLMISALITIPALLYAPKSVFSPLVVLLSVAIGLIGIFIAFLLNLPVGPTIVIVGFTALIFKTILKSRFLT
jgi:ABC-type Mn2+/Zn2+ transport system permease subunit